jgi:hypothetical protein
MSKPTAPLSDKNSACNFSSTHSLAQDYTEAWSGITDEDVKTTNHSFRYPGESSAKDIPRSKYDDGF